DRIFHFAGWTYNGSIFSREAFSDLYLSYPKPPPTDEPLVTELVNENSEIQTTLTQIPTPNGTFLGSVLNVILIQQALQVQTTGTHRITITGDFFTNSLGQSSTFVRIRVTDFVTPTYDEVIDFPGNPFVDIFAEAGKFITLELTDETG
ncbi:hypothetical protein RZS08_26780, partial [Arthrospira platensis SPKY1]|nr:hypothetical protein [Arthrospira platensis SPKY1]